MERGLEERPHRYEDSCGTASHVNEDDEKLNTFFIEEKDHRSIMIIGGIKIFLPRSQGEASVCVGDAMAKGQPTKTIMEEKEKILKSSPIVGTKEHAVELLTQ
jgi:hypothetical protein